VFTNRSSGGEQYQALETALKRLQGTTLKTNIKTGDEVTTHIFGLIESAVVRHENEKGRVLEWGVTLSEWLMRAIEANEVLTLNRDYFRLSRPLERRIYEIARKHCGTNKNGWRIGLDKLQSKCGSTSPRRNFRIHIQRIAEYDHLPDYEISFDDESDMVFFFARPEFLEGISQAGEGCKIPELREATIKKFRKSYPGKDVYHYQAEWRDWASTKSEPPTNPDAAFLAFARKRMMADIPEG